MGKCDQVCCDSRFSKHSCALCVLTTKMPTSEATGLPYIIIFISFSLSEEVKSNQIKKGSTVNLYTTHTNFFVGSITAYISMQIK